MLFSHMELFDPSLFVDIRKRAGNKVFDSLNVELIKSVSKKDDEKQKRNGEDKKQQTPEK